jgi:peptidoglycan/LPS O-acetylase OafA/YrhL
VALANGELIPHHHTFYYLGIMKHGENELRTKAKTQIIPAMYFLGRWSYSLILAHFLAVNAKTFQCCAGPA